MCDADLTLDLEGLLQKGRGADWCALGDGTQLHINSNGIGGEVVRDIMTYHMSYTVEFLQQKFPHATIRDPVHGEIQHCCIIKR